MNKYSFAKYCDSARLTKEILAGSIVIALDHIETTVDTTDVWFKTVLDSTDSTTLSDLVTAHLATTLPDESQLVRIEQSDIDTGSLSVSPKWAPDGWHQQYFETEFETSNSSADSIHEKDWTSTNIGYSSLKFYNAVGEEITDQSVIDSDCVRTDLLWMPTHDYFIKSGYVSQKSVPSENVYVWCLAVDLDAAYGGAQVVFAEGGINLTYVDARVRNGLDGVAGSRLNYSHPQLGDGKGTNRIRFVVRHPSGFKHRLQAVFELFVQ